MVKTGASGTHEVPWRHGNSTVLARRADLLRCLIPTIKLPDVEIVSGDASLVSTHIGPAEHDYGSCFRVRLRLYVAPRTSERTTIPRHKCTIVLTLGAREIPLLPYSLQLLPPSEPRTDLEKAIAPFSYAGPEDAHLPASLSIQATQSEAIISGPGFLLVKGEVLTRERPADIDVPLLLNLRLAPAGGHIPIIVSATMVRSRIPLSIEPWWHCG